MYVGREGLFFLSTVGFAGQPYGPAHTQTPQGPGLGLTHVCTSSVQHSFIRSVNSNWMPDTLLGKQKQTWTLLPGEYDLRTKIDSNQEIHETKCFITDGDECYAEDVQGLSA